MHFLKTTQNKFIMPFYQDLDPNTVDGKRTIEKLIKLRYTLKEQVPTRTQSKTLLLATWNIRDFDKPTYGYRLEEAFYYIAEMVSAFDIVAVQEVYRNLFAINKVMNILGSNWKFIFSDATEGPQGNGERIAFLYDSRKIRFGGLAGEMVLPNVKDENGNRVPIEQIWRTPLICGFTAGWAKFMLCGVHIQWGESTANSEERVREIHHVAEFLKKRTEDPTAWARKLILLGDFNIFKRGDKTYQVLEEAGFKCPEPLLKKEYYTNTGKNKRQYDQILLRERKNKFEVISGGNFNFFDVVFKDDEEQIYRPLMKKPKSSDSYKNYKQWRTHQMSDHLPLWVELRIDYADEYLENKLASAELFNTNEPGILA